MFVNLKCWEEIHSLTQKSLEDPEACQWIFILRDFHLRVGQLYNSFLVAKERNNTIIIKHDITFDRTHSQIVYKGRVFESLWKSHVRIPLHTLVEGDSLTNAKATLRYCNISNFGFSMHGLWFLGSFTYCTMCFPIETSDLRLAF
jgi:hypothetical protein